MSESLNLEGLVGNTRPDYGHTLLCFQFVTYNSQFDKRYLIH